MPPPEAAWAPMRGRPQVRQARLRPAPERPGQACPGPANPTCGLAPRRDDTS